MYRQYENPCSLEVQLTELKQLRANTTDEDRLISLDEDINDLEHRINCAWQDEEYD